MVLINCCKGELWVTRNIAQLSVGSNLKAVESDGTIRIEKQIHKYQYWLLGKISDSKWRNEHVVSVCSSIKQFFVHYQYLMTLAIRLLLLYAVYNAYWIIIFVKRNFKISVSWLKVLFKNIDCFMFLVWILVQNIGPSSTLMTKPFLSNKVNSVHHHHYLPFISCA